MNYEIHKCIYYIVKKKAKHFHEGGCYISLSEEKKKNNESNLGPAMCLNKLEKINCVMSLYIVYHWYVY